MKKLIAITSAIGALALTACGSASNPALARAVDHCYNLNPDAGRSACQCLMTRAEAHGYNLNTLATITVAAWVDDSELTQLAFNCVGGGA